MDNLQSNNSINSQFKTSSYQLKEFNKKLIKKNEDFMHETEILYEQIFRLEQQLKEKEYALQNFNGVQADNDQLYLKIELLKQSKQLIEDKFIRLKQEKARLEKLGQHSLMLTYELQNNQDDMDADDLEILKQQNQEFKLQLQNHIDTTSNMRTRMTELECMQKRFNNQTEEYDLKLRMYAQKNKELLDENERLRQIIREKEMKEQQLKNQFAQESLQDELQLPNDLLVFLEEENKNLYEQDTNIPKIQILQSQMVSLKIEQPLKNEIKIEKFLSSYVNQQDQLSKNTLNSDHFSQINKTYNQSYNLNTLINEKIQIMNERIQSKNQLLHSKHLNIDSLHIQDNKVSRSIGLESRYLKEKENDLYSLKDKSHGSKSLGLESMYLKEKENDNIFRESGGSPQNHLKGSINELKSSYNALKSSFNGLQSYSNLKYMKSVSNKKHRLSKDDLCIKEDVIMEQDGEELEQTLKGIHNDIQVMRKRNKRKGKFQHNFILKQSKGIIIDKGQDDMQAMDIKKSYKQFSQQRKTEFSESKKYLRQQSPDKQISQFLDEVEKQNTEQECAIF